MYKLIYILCLACCLADSCWGQGDLRALEARLDAIMTEGIDSMAFPGAQLVVRYRDSIYLKKSWGYHTYERQRPAQVDDIYDLASVTKVSTGLPLLMKLYGEKKIDLDLPIYHYIPELKCSNKKKITLRQVLAHQARLEPYIVFWQDALKKNGKFKARSFKDKFSKNYPIKITDHLYLHKRYKKRMYKAIKKSDLRQETVYLYSGLIFLLMPDLISDLTDQPFEQLLYDEIYHPIGAATLRYNPLTYFDHDRIVPTEYDSSWRQQLVHGTVHDETAAMLGGVSCNAGLFASAEDLSDLFQLYLNRGAWEGHQIIHPEAIDIFTSYQYVGNRRGLGFDKPMHDYNPDLSYVSRYASPQSYGHSGFTGTFVWADPDYDLVVVFLSNRVHPLRTHQQLYSLGLRPRLHDAIYEWVLGMQ